MKITNNYNLPEAVYQTLSQSSYNPGESDYSATTLLKPPRMVQLERRYWDELTEDVMDRVWSLFGQAAHSILEAHATDDALSEERLYADVLGRKVGGQVDNYHNKVITDYKVTSAWTLVYGSRIKEWEEQLNIYAYLFGQNGYDVESLQIVAILRDWDKNKAAADQLRYPQSPIQIIPLNLWGADQQEAFVYDRVVAMLDNEERSDERLEFCSAEDMWEQESKYAIMKVGVKKAYKLFDSKEAAEEYHILNLEGREDYYIQTRPGKRTRCESGYCHVSRFCNQYRQYMEGV